MAYEGWTDGTEQCRFERAEKPVLKKTAQNRPKCWYHWGNLLGFGRVLDHFLDTFLMLWLDVNLLIQGDFAPLPCTVYLVIKKCCDFGEMLCFIGFPGT